MKTETIDFGHGRVEVSIDGNLIYFRVFGEYTDDDVMLMTQYMEKLFTEIGGPTIRIWDATNIPEGKFKLTSEGTDRFREWSEMIKKKWPHNVVYMIAPSPLAYGVSRMYELKASSEDMSITVVRNIDELPNPIRERIPS